MLPDATLPVPRLAPGAACLLRPVVHRHVDPHVLRPGLRVHRADGEADGMRDAGRDGPVQVVEP